MSKTMYLIRHADRVGNRLTERGIAETREFGKSLGNQSLTLLYSALPWSRETVRRIIPSLEFVQVQGKENRLSPDCLFEEMFPPAVEKLMSDRQVPPLLALAETYEREKLKEWKVRLAVGVRQIFDGLPPAGICIAVGHDPFIQLAIGGLGGEVPHDMLRLSSFSGFRITRENSGMISALPYRWPEERI